jgi:hypothetical protein
VCACFDVSLCLQRFLKRYEASRGLGGKEWEGRKQRETQKDDGKREVAPAAASASSTAEAKQSVQREAKPLTSPRTSLRNTIDPK